MVPDARRRDDFRLRRRLVRLGSDPVPAPPSRGGCEVYQTRPHICREYSSDNCDYHGGDYGYELFFAHPEQMTEYAEKMLAKKGKGGKKDKKRKKDKA